MSSRGGLFFKTTKSSVVEPEGAIPRKSHHEAATHLSNVARGERYTPGAGRLKEMGQRIDPRSSISRRASFNRRFVKADGPRSVPSVVSPLLNPFGTGGRSLVFTGLFLPRVFVGIGGSREGNANVDVVENRSLSRHRSRCTFPFVSPRYFAQWLSTLVQ